MDLEIERTTADRRVAPIRGRDFLRVIAQRVLCSTVGGLGICVGVCYCNRRGGQSSAGSHENGYCCPVAAATFVGGTLVGRGDGSA
jgi:hypothetical protein